MTPGWLHEARISGLEFEFGSLETLGFRRRLNELEPLLEWEHGTRPDAYMVDEDRRRIVAFEVEDKHPIDSEKARLYADLWFALDAYDWDFHLYVVDRAGARHRFELLTLWYAKLGEERVAA